MNRLRAAVSKKHAVHVEPTAPQRSCTHVIMATHRCGVDPPREGVGSSWSIHSAEALKMSSPPPVLATSAAGEKSTESFLRKIIFQHTAEPQFKQKSRPREEVGDSHDWQAAVLLATLRPTSSAIAARCSHSGSWKAKGTTQKAAVLLTSTATSTQEPSLHGELKAGAPSATSMNIGDSAANKRRPGNKKTARGSAVVTVVSHWHQVVVRAAVLTSNNVSAVPQVVFTVGGGPGEGDEVCSLQGAVLVRHWRNIAQLGLFICASLTAITT